MRRIILGSLLALLLLLQAACAIGGCRMVVVNSKRLEGMAGVRLMRSDDPVNRTYWTKDIYSGNRDSTGQIDGNPGRRRASTEQHDPFRIKYHPSYSANRWMAVEAKLFRHNPRIQFQYPHHHAPAFLTGPSPSTSNIEMFVTMAHLDCDFYLDRCYWL